MKITDVKVTVWEWRDIPPTRYTLRVKSAGSRSTQMGLVRIITDEGIEGNAFLGSALSPLGGDAQLIIDRYKPMLVGQDPLLPFSMSLMDQRRIPRGTWPKTVL